MENTKGKLTEVIERKLKIKKYYTGSVQYQRLRNLEINYAVMRDFVKAGMVAEISI